MEYKIFYKGFYRNVSKKTYDTIHRDILEDIHNNCLKKEDEEFKKLIIELDV